MPDDGSMEIMPLDAGLEKISQEIMALQVLSKQVSNKCIEIVQKMHPDKLSGFVDPKDVLAINANLGLALGLLEFIDQYVSAPPVETVVEKPKRNRKSK